MKVLYISFVLGFLGWIVSSCVGSSKGVVGIKKEQPVVIKNDSLAYEVVIIDNGFNSYLNTLAKPIGYYSQKYLETKNRLFVTTWNYRASNPLLFDASIYENIIDYNPNIDYGYEVNYTLFNYFEFAQRKYRMRLQ